MSTKLVASEKLITAINLYGRKQLSADTDLSMSLINQVCSHDRAFSPKAVMEKLVPVLWPKQKVLLTDVWEIQSI